jgi:hypothetical protein
MRINLDLTTTFADDLEIARADFMGYYHPRDIVADPVLSVGRKRALLAHWLSDIHAVHGTPALRRSPCGVTANVDDLLFALNRLDEMVEPMATGAHGGHSASMLA